MFRVYILFKFNKEKKKREKKTTQNITIGTLAPRVEEFKFVEASQMTFNCSCPKIVKI